MLERFTSFNVLTEAAFRSCKISCSDPQRHQGKVVHRVQQVYLTWRRHLARNLLPMSLASAPGPSGAMVRLDSTFSQRGEAGYQDALGTAILAACRNIPDGVLCFFPSWGLLNAATQGWAASGKIASIAFLPISRQLSFTILACRACPDLRAILPADHATQAPST